MNPQNTDKNVAHIPRELSGIGSVSTILSVLDKTAIISATDETGKILYANEKFIEISGYTKDQLLGQNHRILKSGDQPQKMFDELWKTISTGKTWRGEIKNRAKNGSFYWVDTSIAPYFDEVSGLKRYISIRFVITEQKTLEAELKEKISQLDRFNKLIVDRELRMIGLKKELKDAQIKR